MDAGELIQLPEPSPASAPVLPETLPKADLPLRLIPRTPAPGFPDAVLLDDRELPWLRDCFIGKPLAEIAYLIPGSNRHLLTAPGGLPDMPPFGIPLRRIGPGGLHLQEGRAFYPPLPESARAKAFPCAEEEIIAVASDSPDGEIQARRFRLDRMIPLWTLWLCDPPKVVEGMQGEAAARIRKLAKTLQPIESPNGCKRQSGWQVQEEKPPRTGSACEKKPCAWPSKANTPKPPAAWKPQATWPLPDACMNGLPLIPVTATMFHKRQENRNKNLCGPLRLCASALKKTPSAPTGLKF